MDASVSALVFLSAIYGEKMRGTAQPAHVSKSLEGTKADHQEITATKPPHGQKKELHFVQYLCLNFSYFAAMGLTVIILQYFPSVMIALQHIAFMGFIVNAFAQWIPFKIGYLLGITIGTVWSFSVRTQFRWIIKNLIITMFAFLRVMCSSETLPSYEIFLWTALVYDVCLLA